MVEEVSRKYIFFIFVNATLQKFISRLVHLLKKVGHEGIFGENKKRSPDLFHAKSALQTHNLILHTLATDFYL